MYANKIRHSGLSTQLDMIGNLYRCLPESRNVERSGGVGWGGASWVDARRYAAADAWIIIRLYYAYYTHITCYITPCRVRKRHWVLQGRNVYLRIYITVWVPGAMWRPAAYEIERLWWKVARWSRKCDKIKYVQ